MNNRHEHRPEYRSVTCTDINWLWTYDSRTSASICYTLIIYIMMMIIIKIICIPINIIFITKADATRICTSGNNYRFRPSVARKGHATTRIDPAAALLILIPLPRPIINEWWNSTDNRMSLRSKMLLYKRCPIDTLNCGNGNVYKSHDMGSKFSYFCNKQY